MGLSGKPFTFQGVRSCFLSQSLAQIKCDPGGMNTESHTATISVAAPGNTDTKDMVTVPR